MNEYKICPSCNSTGRTENYEKPCEECDGEGEVEMKTIKLKTLEEIRRQWNGASPTKQLEAEDKTLTQLAANLDVPLWKAMHLADYGKKANMAMVNKVGEEYIKELYNYFISAGGDVIHHEDFIVKSTAVKEFLRRLNE